MSAIVARFLIYKEPILDIEHAEALVEDYYRRPYAKRYDCIYVKPSIITEEAYDLLKKERIAVAFM